MMRLDDVTRKIYDEVDACLVQLNKIAAKRHNLVHRYVSYERGAIHVTNVFTAKSYAAVEEEAFHAKDLQNMRLDCTSIFLRLHYVREPEAKKQLQPALRKFLYGPWLYTPLPPKTPPKPDREEITFALASRISRETSESDDQRPQTLV
jgi:hypothetical protein